MIFVALLRGINVGGKTKVEMSRLQKLFESLHFTHIKTYINSGNIIFITDKDSNLQTFIEDAIAQEFGMDIDIVLLNYSEIGVISKAIPISWTNDKEQKTDILFLRKEIDNEHVLQKLPIKPDIETVRYVPGAVLWNIKRENVTKSGLVKIVGTPLYKQMTIRNVNTVRKLEHLMTDILNKARNDS